jgi:hypothetical protein
MQLAGLVRLLLIISSILIVACSTVEEVVIKDGETYLVKKDSVCWVTTKKTQERITITQEEYEQLLERKQKEHDAKMERQKAEQKLKQQMICTWIVGACIAAGVACLFLGYITKQVIWWAGLSILSFSVAAGVAIFGDLLRWIHSVSGYAIIVIVAGGTLFLFRKFSLLEWVKINILNEKGSVNEDTKEAN